MELNTRSTRNGPSLAENRSPRVNWREIPLHPYYQEIGLGGSFSFSRGDSFDKAVEYIHSELFTKVLSQFVLSQREGVTPQTESKEIRQAALALSSLGIANQAFVFGSGDDKEVVVPREDGEKLKDAYRKVAQSDQYVAMPLTFKAKNGRYYSSSLNVDIDYPIFNKTDAVRVFSGEIQRLIDLDGVDRSIAKSRLEMAIDSDLLRRLLTAYSYFEDKDGFNPVIEVDPKTLKPHFTVWCPVIDAKSANEVSKEMAEAFFSGFYDPSIYETSVKVRALSRPGCVNKSGSGRRVILLSEAPEKLIKDRLLANSGNTEEIDTGFFERGLEYESFALYADENLIYTPSLTIGRLTRRRPPTLMRDFASNSFLEGAKDFRPDLSILSAVSGEKVNLVEDFDLCVSERNPLVLALGREILYLLGSKEEDVSFLGAKGVVGREVGFIAIEHRLGSIPDMSLIPDIEDQGVFKNLYSGIYQTLYRFKALKADYSVLRKMAKAAAYSVLYSQDSTSSISAHSLEGRSAEDYIFDDISRTSRGFGRESNPKVYLFQSSITGIDPIGRAAEMSLSRSLRYASRVAKSKEDGVFEALEQGSIETANQMALYQFAGLEPVIEKKKTSHSALVERALTRAFDKNPSLFSKYPVKQSFPLTLFEAIDNSRNKSLDSLYSDARLPVVNMSSCLALVDDQLGHNFVPNEETFSRTLRLTKLILGRNTPGLQSTVDIAKRISDGGPFEGPMALLTAVVATHLNGLSQGGKVHREARSFATLDLSRVTEEYPSQMEDSSTEVIDGDLLKRQYIRMVRDLSSKTSEEVLKETGSSDYQGGEAKAESLEPPPEPFVVPPREVKSVALAYLRGSEVDLRVLGPGGKGPTTTKSELGEDLGSPLDPTDFVAMVFLLAFGLPGKQVNMDAALKIADAINAFHRRSFGKSKQLSSRYLSLLSGVSPSVCSNAIRLLTLAGYLDRKRGKLEGTLIGDSSLEGHEEAKSACEVTFGRSIFGQEKAVGVSFTTNGEFTSIYTKVSTKKGLHTSDKGLVAVRELVDSLRDENYEILFNVLHFVRNLAALEVGDRGGIKDEYDRLRKDMSSEENLEALKQKLQEARGGFSEVIEALLEIAPTDDTLDSLNPVLSFTSPLYSGEGGQARRRLSYLLYKIIKSEIEVSVEELSTNPLVGEHAKDVDHVLSSLRDFGAIVYNGKTASYRPSPTNRRYLYSLREWELTKERYRLASREFRRTYRMQKASKKELPPGAKPGRMKHRSTHPVSNRTRSRAPSNGDPPKRALTEAT